MKENLRKQWNDACLSIGVPALTTDTSARIMAVLMVHGNNEAFTHNTHFIADAEYIQKKFQLYGTGRPPADFAELLRKYVAELEEYNELHKNEAEGCIFSDAKPEWAVKLFKDMYNINI